MALGSRSCRHLAAVFLGRRQGYKNPDEHYLASLSTTTSPRTLSTSPHPSTSTSIIMGWFGDDSQEAQHYNTVLHPPRSHSLRSRILIMSYLHSSTKMPHTKPTSLTRPWAQPLHSTLPKNTRTMSLRTENPTTTLSPRSLCRSPLASYLRHRGAKPCLCL